ncbi:MAG: hypothetical protein IJ831_04940 [Spirochaetales bacterium]|nr:hypothetical protein [Spirochaetales bacterium]
MNGYKDRVLEIHGINMWNMFHVDRAIRFARKYNMTGIIFHCNEFIDRMIFPDKYFTKDELLKYNPVRNSVTKNNRYYFRSVLDKCRANGLEFYAEVKEIYYPYDLLTKFPGLRKADGQVCATDPFWWEFLEAKYEEFFRMFPEVAGISVSPGTRESMVSFAANRCTCERCRNYDVDLWYHNLLEAMHRPIAKAGKRLIVRDFSYTKAHQFAMVDAARSVASDIVMSMKKVPHDYYPVFPDNPAVGSCGELGQWVEYDTWGQFFGLGVFPCSVVEDMKGRMERYLEKGATGITLRTDWENFTQSSTFCSFNMLNVIAGAMLGRDVNTTLDEIYSEWFRYGLVSPLIQDTFDQKPCRIEDEDVQKDLRKLVQLVWKGLEKGIHVRGHVFNRNCQCFDRYDLTYNIMTVFHSRDQWEKDAHLRVEPTDENIPLIIEEKREAVAIAESAGKLALSLRDRIEDENIRKYLEYLSKAFVLYLRGFELEARTMVYTKRAELDRDREFIRKAESTLSEYEPLAKEYRDLVVNRGYSHIIEYMSDGDRLIRYRDSVEAALKAIGL